MPSGFCFLVQIRAFIILSSLGFLNLNMKGKTKRILVVVVKRRHRANGLFSTGTTEYKYQETPNSRSYLRYASSSVFTGFFAPKTNQKLAIFVWIFTCVDFRFMERLKPKFAEIVTSLVCLKNHQSLLNQGIR